MSKSLHSYEGQSYGHVEVASVTAFVLKARKAMRPLVLLAVHANPKAKNFDGETPLDLARKAVRDRQQTVQIIEDALKQQEQNK